MARRIKLKGAAVYHCISRTVAGQHLLDAEAKEVFRKMLWAAAEFSGVEIVTFCVMSNHFHVLVRIPEKAERIERPELLRRYTAFYEGRDIPGFPSPETLGRILAREDDEAKNWEQRLRSRMEDVSAFMKSLKQRFALWYNRRHKRFGVFWAERFRSSLVENRPQVLQTVAAYIDLNPVRAKLVKDPAEYRWCCYAEAMAGRESARRGLATTVDAVDAESGLEVYRTALFGKGSVAREEGHGVIESGLARSVLAKGGKVSRTELLRCRVRYFSFGAIIGSRDYVEQTGDRLFSVSGSNLMPGQRRLGKLPVSEGDAIWTWRKLQKDVIS